MKKAFSVLGVLGVFIFACAGYGGPKSLLPLSSRFQDVDGSNGAVVRDMQSGLEWQRCPVGQAWTGTACSGAAVRMNWHQAVKRTAAGGFRLPTIDELKTLAPYNQAFVSGDYCFWSSSSDAGNPDEAWGLILHHGYVGTSAKDFDDHVLLVRSGK